MDGSEWTTLLKWMIWGYHYFWKHLRFLEVSNIHFTKKTMSFHQAAQSSCWAGTERWRYPQHQQILGFGTPSPNPENLVHMKFLGCFSVLGYLLITNGCKTVGFCHGFMYSWPGVLSNLQRKLCSPSPQVEFQVPTLHKECMYTNNIYIYILIHLCVSQHQDAFNEIYQKHLDFVGNQHGLQGRTTFQPSPSTYHRTIGARPLPIRIDDLRPIPSPFLKVVATQIFLNMFTIFHPGIPGEMMTQFDKYFP